MQQAEPTHLEEGRVQQAPALRVRQLAQLEAVPAERVAVRREPVLPEQVAVQQVAPTLPGPARVAEAVPAPLALARVHRLAAQVVRVAEQLAPALPGMVPVQRLLQLPGPQLGQLVERAPAAWQQVARVVRVALVRVAQAALQVAVQVAQVQAAQWRLTPVAQVLRVEAERVAQAGRALRVQRQPIPVVLVQWVRLERAPAEQARAVVQQPVAMAEQPQLVGPVVAGPVPVLQAVQAVQVAQAVQAVLVEQVAV